MEKHKPKDHRSHGRWVKTSTRVAGAHQSPDGKYVGIYQMPREGSPVSTGDKLATPPAPRPEHVIFVKPNGGNLVNLNEKDEAEVVRMDPANLENLEACEIPGDLPPSRVAHLAEAK